LVLQSHPQPRATPPNYPAKIGLDRYQSIRPETDSEVTTVLGRQFPVDDEIVTEHSGETAHIGLLVESIEPAPPHLQTANVYKRFGLNPNLTSIGAVDKRRRSVGRVNRQDLAMKLARNYGRALHVPFVRLSDRHLLGLIRTFHPMLTTTALYRSSSNWFETCS
jgi:hypothetical protein